ncbi:MAG: hypothetical protein P8P74_07565 [Crocinitomicaceae bacterium]|nr:hypothetical protein [Crocinitomicaceae bacterium]
MEDLLEDPKEAVRSKKRTFLQITTVAVLGVYAACIFFALENIYTIIYAGPIIGGIGIFTAIVALVQKEKTGIILGCWTFFSVLGIFLLIYFLEISPLQARLVVPIIGGFCLLVLFGIAIWLFVSVRRR